MSAGLIDWITPSRTALLILDMQADFASPQGVLGQAGVDLSAVPMALAAAQRLVNSARAAHTPVIFVGLQTRPETDSPAWREWKRRIGGDVTEDAGVCRTGEPGAAFFGPTPLPGEIVISKTRYSAFFRTPLDAALKERGADTLVVCGLTTECCVDCTVRDAFHLDYHVFIATDACAAYEADIHIAALKALELNCAILATVDQIEQAWSAAA